MNRLRPIMLGGTGSDVGKSLLTAGLCRIFLQDGYTPAPFKAQNMALNSYVTPDGLEIGRAQAVQAMAAGLDCMVEMNPVLLKPCRDTHAQLVLMGKPTATNEAGEYFNPDYQRPLREIATDAFIKLEQRFNPIIMEGAGSVAEINLLDRDFVNMPMAEAAGASVILVADINRGGVFAQAYGSIKLLPERFRKLIRGIIINKFRGNLELFRDGRTMIEEMCGVPVLGVVPYFHDIDIEEEDSLQKEKLNTKSSVGNLVNIAVPILPRISNFTDFDFISRDPRVHLYFTSDPEEIKKAEVIILPGTKNTIADLIHIRETGCAEVIKDSASRGVTVIGICGGYQMMGRRISDPLGVEGRSGSTEGLGLLPVSTTLTSSKTLTRTKVIHPDTGVEIEGYEIHMGETLLEAGAEPMFIHSDGLEEGCKVSDSVWGTYLHGLLDNQAVIDMIVKEYAERRSLPLRIKRESQTEYRERQFDLLAGRLRECLDMETIYQIMKNA